jgi:hypothetical protein
VTCTPLKPPSCTKNVRDVTAGTTTVDARGLAAHTAAPPSSPALSLPARQLKDAAHVGHPSPTYSTVLLALWPHVVTVSAPPSGASSPKLR